MATKTKSKADQILHIYTRVSTLSQADRGSSLQTQLGPLVNLTREKTLRLRYTCTISGTYAKGCLMDAMTYSTARANLAGVMNRVCEDHEPLIITRNGDQSVVMLSLDDYKALEETAYLLRTPANARRLLTSIAQLNAGQAVERELIK